MSTGRSVEAKVSDWLTAYRAIQAELTPEAFRVMTQIAMTPNEDGKIDVAAINVGLSVARVVFSNDRAAATVAALLTANGIKPIAVGDAEDF